LIANSEERNTETKSNIYHIIIIILQGKNKQAAAILWTAAETPFYSKQL